MIDRYDRHHIRQITFAYSDEEILVRIFVHSDEWSIVDGISFGDDIQSVLDNDKFSYITHYTENRYVAIMYSDDEDSIYELYVHYDIKRKITSIFLDYYPDEDYSLTAP